MDTIDRLIAAMEKEFGADRRRIEHALKVLDYARRILSREGGKAEVALAAAVLHDIGIQEAERRHGSSAARYQELEGPPIARRILNECGALAAPDVEHVCRIVGSHHSAGDIDTPEFRIVWDADWLVNFRAVYPLESGADAQAGRAQSVARIHRVFRTASGRALALAELLPPSAPESPVPAVRP